MGSEIHPLVERLAEANSGYGSCRTKMLWSGDAAVASQVIRKWLEERVTEWYGDGNVFIAKPCLCAALGLTQLEKSLEQKIEEALAGRLPYNIEAAKIAAEIAEKHFKGQS